MNFDLYTKTILTVIAICLLLLTLHTVEIFPNAMAADSFSCSGSLRAKAFGGIEPMVGGYRINIDCS